MGNRLGSFLQTLRGNRSLREIAKKSGLSHSYIRDLELGYRQTTKKKIQPSPDSLKRLADAYDYPYEELLKMAGFISSNTIENLSHSSDSSAELFQNTHDLLDVLKQDGPLFVGNYSLTTNDKKKVKEFLELFFLKY
ncbi:helix-turn-helix domain-containing protein [Robertmurraya sp.]|uniref:helix-turn-helix domain-containing protein n=1 Tax=Robertmurraya sp. TaxID=2837525 RepID=UPI00370437C1